MASIELRRSGPLAYREAVPDGAESGPPVVLVHGFPESSLMWEPLMAALAERGRRSVAPDLYCLGASEDPGPATFERNLDAFTELVDELGLGRCALVVHDWGGFIGLAWASSHPESVAALVISDTGFFADGKWHGMAEAVRGDRGRGAGRARSTATPSPGCSAPAAPSSTRRRSTPTGRRSPTGAAARRRSSSIARWTSRSSSPTRASSAALGVPTLLLWGADDPFAPLAGAHRFEREIPGAELVAIEGAGHFVFDQEPERTTGAVVDFLLDTEAAGA